MAEQTDARFSVQGKFVADATTDLVAIFTHQASAEGIAKALNDGTVSPEDFKWVKR